jgi:ribosome biogenesis GTPase
VGRRATDPFATATEAQGVSTRTVARVDLRGAVVVDPAGELAFLPVRKRLMERGARLGNAIVVGDQVEVEDEAIVAVAPRKNRFERRSAGARAQGRVQVVAANLDRVLAVVALKDPVPSAGLVDRFAVTCEWLGLPFAIAFTKADLVPPAFAREQQDAYARAGYPTFVVAAPTGSGLDAIARELEGRRTLFVGHSGVGKSTLLAALVPGLELKVGAVNAKTGKGRHTTTAATLVRLADAPLTEVIDTPGVRGFGLPGVDRAGLARFFPELADLPGCRFGDCTHRTEPGCAVRAAVDSGRFARARYDAYLRLLEELDRDTLAGDGSRGRS